MLVITRGYVSNVLPFHQCSSPWISLDLPKVTEPVQLPVAILLYHSQWIGWRENLQETMVFTIKYRVSCKFSHHPILWHSVRNSVMLVPCKVWKAISLRNDLTHLSIPMCTFMILVYNIRIYIYGCESKIGYGSLRGDPYYGSRVLT